jgi:hypothetical protein
MPNRLLRAELLDSEAWLALKDNADRSSWIACFLTVDTFGDMPAGPQRLMKLWRPYGIDTPEKAARVFADLADVDLVRRYECNGKVYLHIPRFNQSPRFPGHLWALSPWATNEQKQIFAKKSRVTHCESPEDVDVDVDVEEKLKAHPRAAKSAARASMSKPTRSIRPKAKAVVSGDPSLGGFDDFWLAFPKKRSKGQAEKAWTKLKPSLDLRRVILDAVTLAKADPSWTKEGGRFIPYPATWLNSKSWEDELIGNSLDVGEVL